MALRSPTEGPRIVPFGVARTAADKLPNGRPSFRVSQTFANPSGYNGAKHGALDLANYNCGDKALASVAGKIANRKDSYGALICEIIESNGNRVGYGHLSAFKQANGATVARGALIGLVGTTGKSSGCHIHYYYRSAAGALLDPWPRLEQNATRRAKMNSGNGINIRVGPGANGSTTMAAIYATSKNGRIIRRSDGKDIGSATAIFTAKTPVLGAKHGVGSKPNSWTPLFIAGAYRYVATPLTTYV